MNERGREGNINLEDELEREERMEILGAVSGVMEKKTIDGDQLDELVKSLFKKYSDHTKETKPHPYVSLSTRVKDILPPHFEIKKRKHTDLDRFSKIFRVFSTIPSFDNSSKLGVRDFLLGLNSVAESLGSEITEDEFSAVLNSKLAPKIKATINSYKQISLKDLFNILVNLYDSNETSRDAVASVLSNKQKFSSLRSFTEETIRLLSLSQKSPSNQADLFVHALEQVLPDRVKEKIINFCEYYESVHGCFPPIPNIVDFLYRFRAEVDLFLCKKKTFVNYTDTPDTSDRDRAPKECGFCQKRGHTENTCFKKVPCRNCNQIGHGEKYCPNSMQKTCGKCGRVGHNTADCRSRCRLCNSLSHLAVKCPQYCGVEPSTAHCELCLEKVNVRMYHPRNVCQFSKN